jgi:hypothetical protein
VCPILVLTLLGFFPLHGTGDHHHLLLVTTFGFASSLSNVNQQWVRELIREHWELREIAWVGWLVGWLVGYALEQALIDLSILPPHGMASHPTRLTMFVNKPW